MALRNLAFLPVLHRADDQTMSVEVHGWYRRVSAFADITV